MNPQFLFITRCRICRKEVAQAPPLHIPVIGAADMPTIQYLAILKRHMDKRHPDRSQALTEAAQEFGGMLMLSVYEAEDPSVNARADLIRSVFVNQFAQRTSDASILDVVARLELEPEKQDQVVQMICAFRDLWTERGEYAPKMGQPESLLVTP